MAECKKQENENNFLANGSGRGLRFVHFFDHRIGELQRARFGNIQDSREHRKNGPARIKDAVAAAVGRTV
jgi:hypothetical protein